MTYRENIKAILECNFAGYREEIIENTCNRILALKCYAEKTGRWIPVSERLPEDGTYLICTDDGYISTIMYDRSMGWLLSANIIAYMPLPQPYKGESEE